MKHFYPLVLFFLFSAFSGSLQAQGFPNPAELSTGQGAQGTLDPIWLVSGWYTSIPNLSTVTFTPAYITNSCAPGAWVNPDTLPAPLNTANWIINPNYPCATNLNAGYLDFRLPLNLPAACDGRNVSQTGSYTLYFSGYADNTIADVFVNYASMGISGGSFASQLSMTLPGPWLAGVNYIDVLVYNTPNGGQANPYGLLLVANSTAVDTADSDGDGVPDISDACPCLYGTRPNGCPPAITGDTIICLGQSTTLYATEPATNYLWSTGATADSIVVSPTSTSSYSLTVGGPFTFRDSGTVNVTVNQPPPATVAPADTVICVNNPVILTASGGASYLWSNSATAAVITLSPQNTATYTVTVYSAAGCTATAAGMVTVNLLPIAQINPATTAICTGDSARLTASGGNVYAWSNAANTATISVSPASSTGYTVTVTDANNCSATATAAVTVNSLPAATVNPDSTAICTGSNTILTAGGGTLYQWSNGAGTASVTVSPAATTAYSVTVTDVNNCSNTAVATVMVNPLPTGVITPPSSQICSGASDTLTAGGGVSYNWSNGAVSSTIVISPAVSTGYSVTVTDANNCTASASASIAVDPPLSLSFADSNVTCFGESNGAVYLTVSGGQQPDVFLWSNAGTSQNITALAAGTYAVSVTDNAGCTIFGSSTINQPLVLALTATANNPTCSNHAANGNISITATGGVQPYQYNWSDTSSLSTLYQLGPGNYAVTVTDANNCAVDTSFTLAYIYSFTVQASPAASISLAGSATLSYTLNGNAGNYITTWSPADGLSCTNCNSPMASPTSTVLYQVEISNDSGCTASDTVSVIVTPNYTIYIPNVFSPNGDGNNDLFKVYGNTAGITFFSIRVFNRWGEMVFESNDINFAWDGTYKGSPLTPGVLVWQMKAVFIDGYNDGSRTGSLTLLR